MHELERDLNAEQMDVVEHGNGPCVVLAGAGSGKTRTITFRVARLLAEGVSPERILLLTFTNKAAREMMARITSLVGTQTHGLWGGTFHSIANRLLREHADTLGLNPRFTILDMDDSQSLVKAILKERKIDRTSKMFPKASVLVSVMSLATNTGTSITDVIAWKHPSFESFASEIEEIAREFMVRKAQANAVDFDDLLKGWLALAKHPDIGYGLRRRFDWILVDEYQDTNALQDEIVWEMGRDHQNVLVVGDDAQSIYAFRGADVRNMLTFPDRWKGTKMFRLVSNYRSTPEILELANESLSHNEKQFEKNLVSLRSHGAKPKWISIPSARQEAKMVAERILRAYSSGTALANFAVLFRSSAHAQALEFELLQRDIPYEIRGGMKFFDRAHTKDVMAFLRLATNHADETAWLRAIALSPGIGATTAMTVTQRAKRCTDAEELFREDFLLSLPVRARVGFASFLDLLRRVLNARPRPGEMIRAILHGGYRDVLEKEYPDYRDRLDDLEALAVFADTYTDVVPFLTDVALVEDAGVSRDRRVVKDKLILSTIHQAKGLEWDEVFIIHASDGCFPNRRAMEEEGGMEEERRLFYVAVTRARHVLTISSPAMVGYEGFNIAGPSQFLTEVPSRLFQREDVRDHSASGWRSLRPSHSSEEPFHDDEPTIEIDRSGSTIWKRNS